jgi:hypothetical protein
MTLLIPPYPAVCYIYLGPNTLLKTFSVFIYVFTFLLFS